MISLPADLAWPFFDDGHRALVLQFERWVADELPALLHGAEDDLDAVYACVGRLVRSLGRAGLLRVCVPQAFGGLREQLDVRSLALGREVLARASGLADFALAMQGLGSAPVTLFGSPEQQQRLLPGVAEGRVITAFALSEPEAGSDVAAMSTTATRLPGGGWRLDGCKTWISNAGLADHYVVFARTGEGDQAGAAGRGTRGISAFMVDAHTPGLDASERIAVIAPHPLGSLRLADCRVGDEALLGEPGQGFKIAMSTLDSLRTTVGAAGLGLARRAMHEAAQRAHSRRLFGQRLADFQLTQKTLGEMAVAVDASALLVYRAAWVRDVQRVRVTREASMAKLHATEAAQRVIDGAVQLFGGLGVVQGTTVERLYREVRALRIYEGASEVLELIIGARTLEAAAARGRP